jgi:hypothetical protein
MFKFAALAVAVCVAGLAGADEYVVKNTRASKLLGIMAGVPPMGRSNTGQATLLKAKGGSSLIPTGVTVEADDAQGKLLIEGPKHGVAELKRYLELLDVKARTVKTSVTVGCIADKHSASSTLEIPNNATSNLGDSVLNLNLTLTPRINEDGTVTCFIGIESHGTSLQAVLRCKLDEDHSLVVMDKETAMPATKVKGGMVDVVANTKEFHNLLAKNPEQIFIKIRFTIEPTPTAILPSPKG